MRRQNIKLVECIWVQESDRYISIRKNLNDEITNINFSQGDCAESMNDSLDYNFVCTEFVKIMMQQPKYSRKTFVEDRLYVLIDEIIWLYCSIQMSETIQITKIK